MIAAVFPGQGSQTPGMGRDLFEAFSDAKTIFDRVSAATSVDVAALCFESSDETLRETQNAQLALYTCGVAAWSVLLANLGPIQIVSTAGHSIGEYAALNAAEILSVEDGAKLVQIRGRLMRESGLQRPGTMAAVLGLSREALEAACDEAGGVVVVANDNSPGQLIISGEVEAVAAAGDLAKAAGAKRVLPLNVSGAFHSPLMHEASEEMGQALAGIIFSPGIRSVYSNVTSEPVHQSEDWPILLEKQLRNPVRWTESIEHMRRDGVETFIECGIGQVLSGLIGRIDKNAKTARVFDHASRDATLAGLAS